MILAGRARLEPDEIEIRDAPQPRSDPTFPKTLAKLTQRQTEILHVILEHVRTRGGPPSIREIGRELGISSSNAIHEHVSALVEKGYIDKIRGRIRLKFLPIHHEKEFMGKSAVLALLRRHRNELEQLIQRLEVKR